MFFFQWGNFKKIVVVSRKNPEEAEKLVKNGFMFFKLNNLKRKTAHRKPPPPKPTEPEKPVFNRHVWEYCEEPPEYYLYNHLE